MSTDVLTQVPVGAEGLQWTSPPYGAGIELWPW